MPTAVLVAAIDLIADGVVLVDAEGTILFVNRPLCDMLGYESAELIGRSVEHLVPFDRRPEHVGDRIGFLVDPVQRRMGRPDLDIEAQHAAGHRIPVDVQLTPLPGTTLTAATVRDMTSEREAAASRAIQRLDLIATMQRNEQMLAYYDVMLQRLFALGTHLQTEARRHDDGSSLRFMQAATVVDQLIDITRSHVFDSRGSNS